MDITLLLTDQERYERITDCIAYQKNVDGSVTVTIDGGRIVRSDETHNHAHISTITYTEDPDDA